MYQPGDAGGIFHKVDELNLQLLKAQKRWEIHALQLLN